MTVAVIVPTLNEAAHLGATLDALGTAGAVHEVIVADGGSTDATRDIARARGATVIDAPRGRGAQVAAGIAASHADIVVLLHADTHLAAGSIRAVEQALSDPGVAGGGFVKRFRDGPALLRYGATLRSRAFFHLTGRLFGDQAIFARRTALAAAGGMPGWPLMEEFELCRRLRTQGRLRLIGPPVTTSGRRFERRGVLRTWALMTRVLWGYWRGRTPQELERIYR